MTVHFFTYGDERSGSSRQRAFKIAEEFNKRGMQAVVHRPSALLMSATPWPKKGALILQLIRALASVKKGDVVYIQRAISNKYFFMLLVSYVFLFRRKMIFDIDDPIYAHSFFKAKLLTQMADAVVACHHAIADWVRQYNQNVHIVHISLDMHAYEKFTHDYDKAQPPVVLGWVGTAPEHIRNLASLVPVLTRLVKESPVPFRFTLIGALGEKPIYDLFDIPGLNRDIIDALDWTDPTAVPREIQKFDIGVQPYELANPWSKTKTSFKIIEYMACGVAVISTPFGEMPYILTDGVNGLLAESEDEWVEKLKLLMADKSLQKRLGRAGQERVREHYSFDAIMPRMIDIIRSVEQA
jgi:glycosyltransferase involved in cell wall biosynthesis